MYTAIPFSVEKNKGIQKEMDVKASVASFLDMLISSPRGSCKSDPNFGFILKNFRFENVNETRGVLYSSSEGEEMDTLSPYTYKIQGKSNNGQRTFALDLKKSIECYEPRLRQVKVNMEYEQRTKTIKLTITGLVGERISEKFEHVTNIHVW